jgi:tetratricopeptide (TPR) repeat protein
VLIYALPTTFGSLIAPVFVSISKGGVDVIGRTISHYRILEELGGGGMGVVYKAEDTRLKRLVALKFLPPELTRDQHAKERFIREAQAASALDHPNICTIHEIDETPEGQSFICMACYEGESLKAKIARGPLPIAEAARIVADVAAGLNEAHRHEIVHRDIKPANIMVTGGGEVKIVDFGLAKLRGAARITETGRTPGTPSYMSPEQIRGEPVDERTDIFALGVVMYELLTGSLPFRGERTPAVQFSIVSEGPEPLSKYRKNVPPPLEAVLGKALQKDPNQRYQSAAEMRDDLERALAGTHGRVDHRRALKLGLPGAVLLAILLAMLLEPPARDLARRIFAPDRPPAEKHIVVLPFENVGGDPANQAFCDGLMETTTSKLTQLEQFHGALWVVPSSEVRGRAVTSASEARREFGINLAFSGSVQRLGEGFRMTLNLIEVGRKAPRQLSSTVFDYSLVGLSALQDEALLKMAAMLNVELRPETKKMLSAGGTAVAASYDSYVQGRGYLQHYESEENIDRAIDMFERAIEEDSSFALAYAGLGEACWRKYNASRDKRWVGRAVESCTRGFELNNMLAPVRVTLGMVYEGTGEYEKAVSEFKRALVLDVANADAYRGLAGAYRDLGRFEEAESTYKKAIDARPEYWAGYDDLGLFYYNRGRNEEALAQFQRSLALTPHNGRLYNHLGAAYYAQEQWENARQAFTRSIEIQPTFRAYSNLGVIEYLEGRYAESAAMVEKALELNDQSHLTWLNLANAYYWIPGKREKAYEIYRRVVDMAEAERRVNPQDPYLLSSLGGYYAILGERERALALLDQALAIAPGDMWVLYDKGHALEQLGEREPALEWIEKALAAGYQRKEMERDPFLADLRADVRYERLGRDGGE